MTIQNLMFALLIISVVLFIVAVVKTNEDDSFYFNFACVVMMLLPFDLNLYLVHLAFKDIPIIIAVVEAFLLLLVEGVIIMAFTNPIGGSNE